MVYISRRTGQLCARPGRSDTGRFGQRVHGPLICGCVMCVIGILGPSSHLSTPTSHTSGRKLIYCRGIWDDPSLVDLFGIGEQIPKVSTYSKLLYSPRQRIETEILLAFGLERSTPLRSQERATNIVVLFLTMVLTYQAVFTLWHLLHNVSTKGHLLWVSCAIPSWAFKS